eukprot:g79348.t1
MFLLSFLLLLRRGLSHTHSKPFNFGDDILVECLDRNRSWVPAFECEENQKPLTFRFGMDTFFRCTVKITGIPEYERIRSIAAQEDALQCRVPMAIDKDFYVPATLTYWGLLEADHVHINHHMNFVFHTMQDKIIGFAAYPVRDRFQFMRTGSVINFHGPFTPYSKAPKESSSQVLSSAAMGKLVSFTNLLAMCALSSLLTGLVLTALYVCRIRPRLIKKYIKKD